MNQPNFILELSLTVVGILVTVLLILSGRADALRSRQLRDIIESAYPPNVEANFEGKLCWGHDGYIFFCNKWDHCGFDIFFASEDPVDTYDMFGRVITDATWAVSFCGQMSKRGHYGYRGLRNYRIEVTEILSIQLLEEQHFLTPDEQILLRGSEEPSALQSEVLLRAAQAGQQTPKEELLRVSRAE